MSVQTFRGGNDSSALWHHAPGVTLPSTSIAPPITVAIPTHDRRETVLMAIESVLEQSHPPIELIVVADGCTDGTAEAVSALGDPRIRAIECPKGPGLGYGNRNRAVESAAGELIAWCSDDDLWLPDHLARIAEVFASEDVDIVTTRASLVTADDVMVPLGMDWSLPPYRQRLLDRENRTPSAAVCHRVDVAKQIGGWRDDPGMPGDLDLWRRMLIAGARSAMVAEPTVLHFKAEGRDQPYERRIAQNARFLARLRDPVAVTGLRLEITRSHQGHAAHMEQLFDQACGSGDELAGRLAHVSAERERLLTHSELLLAQMGRQSGELADLQHRHALLSREAAEWERAALELRAVYAGRWWRLRERLRLRGRSR